MLVSPVTASIAVAKIPQVIHFRALHRCIPALLTPKVA